VYAAGEGVVVRAKRNGGYGRMVEIDHGDGVVTRYAHLSRILVAPGQHIGADDPLGEVGSTGRATGPHLHFEVRLDGHDVDPAAAWQLGAAERLGSRDGMLLATVALVPSLQGRSVSDMDPPRRRHEHRTRRRRVT
jgi:murein DD-endopeptidase MepM/ murein hydrolase activator NlpD